MVSVDIIIPNWNGVDLLAAYLPGVCAATKSFRGTAQVIVVDDASTDSSLALLHREFPDVRIVAHERNQGFGRACGSAARASDADVLIFLNSDVEVDEHFILPLLSPLEKEDSFATVPLILEENGFPARGLLTVPYLRRGKVRYRRTEARWLQEHGQQNVAPWFTFFPVGGAFAVRRERFLDIGGFDDLFSPFYYEDTDLGFCAWRRGWTIQVIPASRVRHMHVGTIARSFHRIQIQVIRKRNRQLYLLKNMTSSKQLCETLAYQMLRILYDLFRFNALTLVASVLAIPRLGVALRRRRAEKRATKLSIETIFGIIEAAWSQNQNALRESCATTPRKSSPLILQ